MTGFKAFIAIGLLSSLLPAAPAYAKGNITSHELAVGGGYSSPTANTNPGENPAGLVYGQGNRLQGTVSSEMSDFSPLDFGGNLFFGNGSAGGRLGATRLTNDTEFNLGLAAMVKSLKLAFGVSATWLKDPGADLDLGVLFNPMGGLRAGVTALSVLGGGIDGYAGGVATDLSSNASFAIDASVDSSFKGLRLKPGFGISLSEIQLTANYGLKIDDTNPSSLRDGFGMGVAFDIGRKLQASFHYNTIVAKYLAQLAYSF
jgi:hypothetical protein